MKGKKILASFFILVFALSLIIAPNDEAYSDNSVESSSVEYIELEGEGDEIEWDVKGFSSGGFKVVWSKNSNPEYPLREGDKYNYHSNPETHESKLDAFDGFGGYYVRVCEYLGGKCGVYSNEVYVVLGTYEYEENEFGYDFCRGVVIPEYEKLSEECKYIPVYREGEDCVGGLKIECKAVPAKMEYGEEENEYEYKEKYEYEKDGVKYKYEYEYEGKKEGFVPVIYEGEKECSEGCLIEGECVPICYRKAGVYCQLGGELVNQSLEGEVCDNNCECASNVCAGGECVSAGTIQKILNWFRNLFG
jgi:hypothetical protein